MFVVRVAFRDRSDYKDKCFLLLLLFFFFFFFFFFFILDGWRFKQATHPILGILVTGVRGGRNCSVGTCVRQVVVCSQLHLYIPLRPKT